MEEDLKEFLEERNKQNGSASENNSEYQDQYMSKMRQQQASFMKNMPKMPTGIPNFKMPKF